MNSLAKTRESGSSIIYVPQVNENPISVNSISKSQVPGVWTVEYE